MWLGGAIFRHAFYTCMHGDRQIDLLRVAVSVFGFLICYVGSTFGPPDFWKLPCVCLLIHQTTYESRSHLVDPFGSPVT